MSIYAKVGTSEQAVDFQPTGFILMNEERPTSDYIAKDDGSWEVDLAGMQKKLYIDTMEFLDSQTNPYEMGSFERNAENTLAQENVKWFNGVWSSYYAKKVALPESYVIDYEIKPHSYTDVLKNKKES